MQYIRQHMSENINMFDLQSYATTDEILIAISIVGNTEIGTEEFDSIWEDAQDLYDEIEKLSIEIYLENCKYNDVEPDNEIHWGEHSITVKKLN